MVWNLFGGLMPPAVDAAEERERRYSRDSGTEEEFKILEREEIKERRHSGDSGNCSEAEEEQNTNRATTLEFQLTQSLLSKVKAGENNKHANSGKQAQLDLTRMNFVINGKTIDKECVLRSYGKNNHLIPNGNNEDYRTFAKQVFTEMFKYVEAEVPSDNILAELITNCNQAGYDGSLLLQLFPIFLKYNLQLPDANDRKINIICNSQDSLNIQYCPNMPVKKLDTNMEICKLDAILEFALKSQNGKVEYEEGKVTLTIPEQLKNYQAEDKSLLDDINEYFKDADNAVVESLEATFSEGPKSFVADPPAEVDSDVDNSFDIIPKSLTFDKLVDIINKAKNGDYNDLDEVISNIKEEKDDIPINPDLKNLKDFCSQQLNLTAQTDHERVRKVLIEKMYKEENATVKGLVLLAIAANDTLVERCVKMHEGILFTQDEDLDRLLLDVGGQCYIKFLLEHLGKKLSSIPSWHGIYEKLKRASSIGNQECVKAILNRFEDTESRDPTISSKLLHYTVETGDYDLVNLLIKNGANVDIQDRNGKTALHYAAASNKDEIVRLLLKEGANEEIKDQSNKTFLAYLGTGASEIKSFFFNVLHQEGLLHRAAEKDNIGRAKRLLAKDKNVNAKNSYGQSPLSVAIKHNRLEIVKLFLEERAEIGKEEVKKAIGAGNLKVIEFLVEKGAVITEETIQCARDACKNCKGDKKQAHSDVLTFLVNIHNERLLKKAIEAGNLKVIELLVSKDAAITKKTIQYARDVYQNCKEDRKQAHSDVLTFLVNIHNERLLKKAIEQGNLKKIELYVKKGAVITKETIQYAQGAYKICKEEKVYIPKYSGGMKAERQNRKEILGFLEGKNSNLVSETATSSQAVNGKNNSQLSSQKSKSAGSKQPQENIVDRRENIMNNEEASIEEPISNNYEVSEMRGSPSKKTPSSPKSQQGGKLLDYIRQNGVKQVEGLFNQPIEADAGVFELLDHVMPTIESIQGLSSGNRKKREKIIKHFIKIVDQGSPPKDCKAQKEKIMKRLEGVLEKLSDVSYKSKTPGVPSFTQETEINDGQFANLSSGSAEQGGTLEEESVINPSEVPAPIVTSEQINNTQANGGQPSNLSNTVPLVQPTTPETPNASSDINDESETEDVTDSMSVVGGKSNENGSEDGYSSDDSSVSVLTVKEIVKPSGNENGRQPDNQNNTALPVQSITPEMPNASLDVGGGSKTTEPVVTATNSDSDDKHSEVSDPLTEDDEKEPLLNGKGNSKQLSDPGKNNTAPQNTQKSKLSTVAICTFAVAGILAGAAAPAAYFAFSVSLLTTGIIAGVAACCLVAAAVIYCCTPKSSVENSNAAEVATAPKTGMSM